MTHRRAVPTALTNTDVKIQWKPPTVPHLTLLYSAGTKEKSPKYSSILRFAIWSPVLRLRVGGSSCVLLHMLERVTLYPEVSGKVLDGGPLKNWPSNATLNSHKPMSLDPHYWCLKGTKSPANVTGLRNDRARAAGHVVHLPYLRALQSCGFLWSNF